MLLRKLQFDWTRSGQTIIVQFLLRLFINDSTKIGRAKIAKATDFINYWGHIVFVLLIVTFLMLVIFSPLAFPKLFRL